MEISRNLGKYILLSYFLVISASMLCDSKQWESSTGTVIQSLNSKIPIYQIPFKGHTKCVIQTIGTLGLLLTFFAGYGCKCSLQLLTASVFLVVSLVNISSILSGPKDLNIELISLFKMLAIAGGLLQEC